MGFEGDPASVSCIYIHSVPQCELGQNANISPRRPRNTTESDTNSAKTAVPKYPCDTINASLALPVPSGSTSMAASVQGRERSQKETPSAVESWGSTLSLTAAPRDLQIRMNGAANVQKNAPQNSSALRLHPPFQLASTWARR